jgi:hypothetical protein
MILRLAIRAVKDDIRSAIKTELQASEVSCLVLSFRRSEAARLTRHHSAGKLTKLLKYVRTLRGFRQSHCRDQVSSPANFGRTSTLLRSRLAVTPSTTARQHDTW